MNDEAYNAERIVATGNPCTGFVADLIKRGVQIELCARPAKAHKLGTADLLPGVNINTDAMARIGATLLQIRPRTCLWSSIQVIPFADISAKVFSFGIRSPPGP